MTSQSDKWFLTWQASLAPAHKDAMDSRDTTAQLGLTAFDISSKWSIANTGSLIMSHLFKETLKSYKIGASIPWLNYNVIKNGLRKRKINDYRIDMVITAFEEEGFIETKEDKIKSLLDRERTIKRLRLTDSWRFLLTSYKRDKKQTVIFPHILGRQVYMSYMAKLKLKGLFNSKGDATGLGPFKKLLIILNNATKDGYINNKEAENTFDNLGGVALWHEIGEGDEIKKDDIRFFTEDDGKRKKINSRVLKAYNQYLLPNQQRNAQKIGMR